MDMDASIHPDVRASGLERENFRFTSKEAKAAKKATQAQTQEQIIREAIASLRLREDIDRLPPSVENMESLKSNLQQHTFDTLVTPTLLSCIAVIISYGCYHYHLGLGWALIITVPVLVSSLQLYIARQVRRDMRNFVDEQRTKRFPDNETTEWMNHILVLLWSNYNLYVAEKMIERVNTRFEEAPLPGVVSQIGVKSVEIGTRPPRLESLKTHRHNPHQLVLDVALEWDADFRMELFAKTSTGLSVGTRAKDFFLKSSIRIAVDLLPNVFPFASQVTLIMLTKPAIDVNVKAAGVGVTELPGLDGWIRNFVVNTVAGILCPPHSFRLDLLELLGSDPDNMAARLEQAKTEKKGLFQSNAAVGAVGGVLKGGAMGVLKGGKVVGKGVEAVATGSMAVGSGASKGVIAGGVKAGKGVIAGGKLAAGGVGAGTKVAAEGVGEGTKMVAEGVGSGVKSTVQGVGKTFGLFKRRKSKSPTRIR